MSLDIATKKKIAVLRAGQSIAFIVRDRLARRDLMAELCEMHGVARHELVKGVSCPTFAQVTKALRKKHGLKHKALRKMVKRYAKLTS